MLRGRNAAKGLDGEAHPCRSAGGGSVNRQDDAFVLRDPAQNSAALLERDRELLRASSSTCPCPRSRSIGNGGSTREATTRWNSGAPSRESVSTRDAAGWLDPSS